MTSISCHFRTNRGVLCYQVAPYDIDPLIFKAGGWLKLVLVVSVRDILCSILDLSQPSSCMGYGKRTSSYASLPIRSFILS